MADDITNRLESHGQQPVPAVDSDFAGRLESHLRVEHAERASTGSRRVRVLLPRLIAAALLAVVGVAGMMALDRDEAGVPVAVIDDEPSAPLDAASQGGDGEDVDGAGERGDRAQGDADDNRQALADPTAEPTPTVQAAEPTAVAPTSTVPPANVVDPTAVGVPTATATATPQPAGSAPPSATPVVPTTPPDAPIPTSTPTARPVEPTSVPTVPPVLSPEPLPTPTASPSPTPTVEREPAPIELNCEQRRVGDAIGVVCSWTAAVTDRAVASYEVTRSRNGGEPTLVSRQRATAPTTFADRDIDFGDRVIYLVQGLDADGSVVAASERSVVQVRDPG